ncbi:hypothetical protein EDF56_103238 [Novosphingobium sp. PhB165]|uniref:hypothetical protein n=1 Tax=Novosphingobium sp. PhB165 TaxID=2485105 RepID=UPI00104C673E|nr:hypothetical protein [Novosphingobium sp. PhB165]TCM19595.1 hypothetical protein EDF56_103238 [Novosphingobium sp. PhB165]
MDGGSAVDQMQGEVDRGIVEVREALGRYAQDQKISGACAMLLNLIDQVEFKVDLSESDSAFHLDRENKIIEFYASPLIRVWNCLYDICDEIGVSDEDRIRFQRAGLNQFIIHELLHIRQKFADFSVIPVIKAGLEGMGLPMLDLAADMWASWVSALVECHLGGDDSEDDLLMQHANALLRAYIIGAFAFDSKSSSVKRQRAIGLIISMLLIQSKLDGKFVSESVNEEWTETTPVFLFDIGKCKRFNAIVVSGFPGLLIEDHDVHDGEALIELWNSVGERPVKDIISLTASFLKTSGAVM